MIAGLLPLTDYISGAENETLRALSGHTNGNIEMRSPSAAAVMTMVAAATIIVRFPPVHLLLVEPYYGGDFACHVQYVPKNMHTVCAVYWLSDAVACSGSQCMGRVWDYARQYASDIC